mgnify:CR=1 FL=1
MAKIFGWSASDEDGCWYYRIKLPLDELRRLGHTTNYGTKMPESWKETADVIIGQRICNPAPTKMWQSLAAKPNRPKLVFEVDDDLFNIDTTNRHAHYFFGNPEIQRNLRDNISTADIVTVTTEPLAEVIRGFNPNVFVVNNALPNWLFERNQFIPSIDKSDERFVAGWAGSMTHSMDFKFAESGLKTFFQRNPDAVFHTIGADYGYQIKISPAQKRYTGWMPGVESLLRFNPFDVGLAPLRPHKFNQSKSAIKAMEYGAKGIPVLANAAYPYEQYILDGATGFLVRRDHEWNKILRMLMNDEAMRIEMGNAGRTLASMNTIRIRSAEWEKALLS